MSLPRRTAALKSHLDAMPGATAEPMAPRGPPSVLIYKVMGKMFAILSIRRVENVILKCDPDLAETLRERYAGVGHRSHLDPRYWISVSLDADVPAAEIKRLVAHSYEQVCAKLTRKQKAELASRSIASRAHATNRRWPKASSKRSPQTGKSSPDRRSPP